MLKIKHAKPLCVETYYFRTKRDLIVENDSFHIYTFFESEYKKGHVLTNLSETNYYLLYFVREGVFEVTTGNGLKILLEPGSFSLSSPRPGEIFRPLSPSCKRSCLLLSKTDFSRKLISCFFPEEELYLPRMPETIPELFRKLHTEFCRDGAENDTPLLLSLFTEMLETLRQFRPEKKTPEPLKTILCYVESNLFNAGLKRENIAEHCSISTSTLDRLFFKHMKMTLPEYILEKRLAHVENLLTIRGIRIKEIAQESGFSSAIHMNFLFRKKHGMTPSQYRKSKLLSHSPYLYLE